MDKEPVKLYIASDGFYLSQGKTPEHLADREPDAICGVDQYGAIHVPPVNLPPTDESVNS